jgi:hypothetical protein
MLHHYMVRRRWLAGTGEYPQHYAKGTASLSNLENLVITAATVPAPALILFGLLLNRGARTYFSSVRTTSPLLSP